MKKILSFLILTLASITISAQDFAPVGATWHYDEQFAFNGDVNYIQFTSEKDTLIMGETCKKIVKRHQLSGSNRPDTEYLFTRNDTVFFLDTAFNYFQILYDFSAEVNDSWTINFKDENLEVDQLTITVNSITTTQINGQDLKTLHVTYYNNDEITPETYQGTIIEQIGDTQYMFNWSPYSSISVDGNYTEGLRCFQSPSLGNYSTGLASSCDYEYVWSGIEDLSSSFSFESNPNPTSGNLNIQLNDNFETINIIVRNAVGQKVNENTFSNTSEMQIHIPGNTGVYFVELNAANKKAVFKVLKD